MKPATPTKPSPPRATPQKAPAATPSRQASAAASVPARPLSVSRGLRAAAQKIVVYGPGGVGKSELCSLLSEVGVEPLFLDIEDSTGFLDVARIDPTPQSWEEVRGILHSPDLLAPFGAIVVDSLTKAEELAIDWTIRNVSHEKGHYVKSIEGYGFGKGYVHVYETFLQLLGDLDAVARLGKHVICTCHDSTEKVPNPAGEDWLQYQPRLQSPPKHGKIRERVKEWCDHLLYIGFDKIVSKDGKAEGHGSRTIYPAELPTHWAKSRLLSEEVPYPKGDTAIWNMLFPSQP